MTTKSTCLLNQYFKIYVAYLTLMLSGRFLTFTSAAICPLRRKEKRVPMVAEPKVSSEAVLGTAGGPSVAHAQASRHRPGAALEKATQGSGNGLQGREG